MGISSLVIENGVPHSKIKIMSQKVYLLILLAAGLIVYCNAFWFPFIWDDDYLIINNPFIKSFSNAGHLFTHKLDPGSSAPYYRPLQVFIYLIHIHLFGLKAFTLCKSSENHIRTSLGFPIGKLLTEQIFNRFGISLVV